MLREKIEQQIWQKQQEYQIKQNSTLRKGKGQGEPRNMAKCHKLARVTRTGKNC